MLLITCTLHICWAEIKEYCIVLYCIDSRYDTMGNDSMSTNVLGVAYQFSPKKLRIYDLDNIYFVFNSQQIVELR